MSSIVKCEKCGEWKEVPSWEGDGVFSTHNCGVHVSTPNPESLSLGARTRGEWEAEYNRRTDDDETAA